MAVGDDAVQTNLVEVGCLKLQHLEDTGTVYLIRCLANLGVDVVTTEARGDQLLTVLVEKLESWPVTACGDLDQLCETVSDLRSGKSTEETEVKEGVDGGVVCTEAVLVVGVVDAVAC